MEIHQLENIKATEKLQGIKRWFSWKINKRDKTPIRLNRKAERNKNYYYQEVKADIAMTLQMVKG